MREILLESMRQNGWTAQWMLLRKLTDPTGEKRIGKHPMYKDGYQWIKELSMKDKLKQIGENIEIYICDF